MSLTERVGTFASIVILLITGLFFLVGFGSAEWRKISVEVNNSSHLSRFTGGDSLTIESTEGLWRSCGELTCVKLPSEAEDWFDAVRAMECLAFLVMLAAGGLSIIFLIFGSKSVGRVLGGLYLLSLVITFVFALTGVIIYAAHGFQNVAFSNPFISDLTVRAEIHVGYSYMLVILSLFGLVFAFNAALVDLLRARASTTVT